MNPGPRRYAVTSTRNSMCSVPLSSLDWSRWWTDGIGGELYLHVAGPDETWHRVRCRHSDTPRLRCEGGRLWWLVDTGDTR